MIILLVSSLYYPKIIGGAEISTQLLAENLVKESGNEIHILTTDIKDSDEILNGVIVHRRRMSNISSFWKFKKSLNSLKRVAYKILDFYTVSNKRIIGKLLDEIKPDIVHVNNIYGFSAVIWDEIDKRKIPIVNTYRDYYVMCPRASLMSNGVYCLRPKALCVIYRRMLMRFMHKVCKHVAISRYVQGQLKKNLNIDSEVIYNSIDVNKVTFEENYSRKKERVRKITKFVFVGALIPTKGILDFARVFVDCNPENMELHILGEGPLSKDIRALNSGSIILHGFVSGEEKKSIMEDMDVAVCPSLWNEPFGRVVIEAFQYALPVITSNMGGLSELVDSVTGIVCDVNSPNTFKEAIEFYSTKWNGLDFLQYERMEELLTKFDIGVQVERYMSIYRDLIEGEQ